MTLRHETSLHSINILITGLHIMTTTAHLPPTRLEVYKDNSNKWRWRLISKAQVRTESPQGYVSKQGCINALKTVRYHIHEAELVEMS